MCKLFSFYACLSALAIVSGFTPSYKARLPSSTLLNARKKKEFVTVKQLMEKVKKDADGYSKNGKNKKKNSRRTRKKVDRPKQKYLYAAQRKELERSGVVTTNAGNDEEIEGPEDTDNNEGIERRIQANLDKNSPITIARNLGMNPALQACEASFAVVETGLDGDDSFNRVIATTNPRIIGELRVGDEEGGSSGMFAYVIEKPAGWAIIEGGKKKKPNKSKPKIQQKKKETVDKTPTKSKGNTKRTKYYDEEKNLFDVVEYDELNMLSVMTPEEVTEFEAEGGFDGMGLSDAGAELAKAASDAVSQYDDDEHIEAVVDNVRNEMNQNEPSTSVQSKENNDTPASFAPQSRPSVVSWLKELKASEGIPIRGGKFWTAVAGAVDIDDSGLVLICPKENVDNLYVDYAKYTAVVGNGKFIAPKGKKKAPVSPRNMASIADAKIDVVAKLRKGRDDDIVLTTEVMIPDGVSSTYDAVQVCQNQLLDGIRGDSNANPLDRRASRRLVHCSSLSVSSLNYDDVVETEVDIAEDIRLYSDRRNNHEYVAGSFLGRAELQGNEHTTAYREINGAADGFPGWFVDRYDQWLFVQHDPNYERGPLPSLHDGKTAGVYYFATERDRSITGSKKGIKPALLEGKVAPEMIPVKENGIIYHANFEDLSTGIFLDQRDQRSWLSRFCTSETRVLNCFSHCGAFSVAAATAGAETVSLDLDKKWLDRVKPQLEANGIESDKHDCIYGDCFDWLRRLGKRGDKFDIVIVDPPSTSVGKKKKRWSARNDYDELVSLAAPLVKEGGLLWTTTNSQQIHPIKFARMCKKGLDYAGIPNAKLERVAAMPSDFPSIGPQNVKNLVWRIP